MRFNLLAAALLITTLFTLPVHAEPTGPNTTTTTSGAFAIGVRIGGYGFRRTETDRRGAWDECRMNGVGLFATRTLSPTFFVEGGVDMYFSEPWPQAPVEGDLPIDRVSGLVSVALGARTQLHARVLAYAQVGVGVELTQLEVPYGDSALQDRQALPDGYVGVGGELRLGARTHLGTTLRVHAMGNFAYDPAKLEMQAGWTTPPTADEVFDASPDLAAQMQFYVRTEL